MLLSPALRAQIDAGPSPDTWNAVRTCASASWPTEAALAEVQEALSGWPPSSRWAGPTEWAVIASGGARPAWWPLVQSLRVDEDVSLQPVEALASIVHLGFGPRAYGADVSALAALPRLRELVMGGLDESALARLPRLPQLERLSVSADRLPDDLAYRLPGLQALSLIGSASLLSLPRLPRSLRSLALGGCGQLVDVSALAQCPELETLELPGCDNLLDLSALKALKQLRHLRLDARVRRSLVALIGLERLESLWIDGGTAALDLAPLAGHRTLCRLGLQEGSALQGLQALADLPALESLHVLRCGNVQLPPALGSLALRELDLEGLPTLQHLPSLTSGTRLTLLRLVGLPQLVTAALPPAERTVVQGCPGVPER